jgi:hypothetical protein
MAYNNDLTWADLAGEAAEHAGALKTALVNGQEAYQEWQSFRAGRTNAQIATALGRTETEVAELDACMSGLVYAYQFSTNQSHVEADWFYAWRKFS